jgi:hypothetical protein
MELLRLCGRRPRSALYVPTQGGRGRGASLTITVEVLVPGADGRSLASIQTEAGTTSDGKPFGFRGMMLLRFDDAGLVEEAWEMIAPLRRPGVETSGIGLG